MESHFRDYYDLKKCSIYSRFQIFARGLQAIDGQYLAKSLCGAGTVCEPDNSDTMAQAMVELALLEDEKLAELGQNEPKFYKKRHSLQCGGQLMQNIFTNIAARNDQMRTA